MKYAYHLFLVSLILAALACGFPSAAPATPTLNSLPPTPNLPFSASPVPQASATPSDSSAPPAASFTGTWQGPDPDDGSTMVLTLTQTGNTLAGTYADSYSGSNPPPGFNGTVTGSVLSPTTAQVTMNLSRHDGVNLILQVDLALTDQNTLSAKVTSSAANPWILKRQ